MSSLMKAASKLDSQMFCIKNFAQKMIGAGDPTGSYNLAIYDKTIRFIVANSSGEVS